MMDSISRSMASVNAYLPDAAPPFDLIEHYIAKKTYYPAAITRVLGVLDRGYKHRVTFNGEIGRNYDDLRHTWDEIQRQIRKLDETLTELGVHDGLSNLSRQVKGLSIVTEQRPASSGSTTSTTTLTQAAISPTASRTSSVRSGSRVTSLPPQRRESLLTTPTPRNRSVSTTTTSSSRSSRLFASFFTPRARSPMAQRPSTAHGTGTMGLIPLEARPRWNASPIANVLGSPPAKIPSVVVTPSRIPRGSGRATPTAATTISPIRNPSATTQPAMTPKSGSPPKSISPHKRVPGSMGRGIPQPTSRLNRMVSNPSLPTPLEEVPTVPTFPKVSDGRRQTQVFSTPSPLKGRIISGIPRPSTAQGMHSSGAAQTQPKWRG